MASTEEPRRVEKHGPDPRAPGRYKMVDLSIALKDDPSPLIPVKVTNLDHKSGALEHQRALAVSGRKLWRRLGRGDHARRHAYGRPDSLRAAYDPG